MANTRDTLGDQATVDGLINHTLTSLEEDGVTILGDYALYKNTALTSVNLPNVITLGIYSLNGCTGLTSIELPKVNTINTYALAANTNLEIVNLSGTEKKTINANAFNNDTKLTHLLVNSSTISTLSATSAFTNTRIARKLGAIYVPTDLIATYKSGTNWSNYFIADINDYPLTNFDSILDSWDTIIANTNYDNDYNVGDIKSMSLGTFGNIRFELVAKNADIKADNSGNARMTWVTKDILTTHNMNSTAITTGGYDASAMKTYLTNDVLPQIPSNIRNAIIPVTKTSSTYKDNAIVKDGQTTTETIWLLSNHEVFNSTTYETTGPVYNTIFNSTTNRIKYNLSGTADWWWLRSASGSTHFRSVSYGGYDYGDSNAGGTNGVVFGFCI